MEKQAIKFDPANFFKTQEDFNELLNDAFESQDTKYIARAIGVVAKAKGIGFIAKQCNLNRENLYKSFSEKGNPTLSTVLLVLNSLGYKLKISAN